MMKYMNDSQDQGPEKRDRTSIAGSKKDDNNPLNRGPRVPQNRFALIALISLALVFAYVLLSGSTAASGRSIYLFFSVCRAIRSLKLK